MYFGIRPDRVAFSQLRHVEVVKLLNYGSQRVINQGCDFSSRCQSERAA